jgi:argininosuccinate synthase
MTLAERLRAVNADPATLAVVVEWLRKDLGVDAVHLMLAAGAPGGTATQRVKNKAFAAGYGHAVADIKNDIETASKELGK